MKFERAIVVVLDSCGCGEMPDAAEYGDAGANTLAHVAERVGGLALPNLAALGLGEIVSMRGLQRPAKIAGCFGRMAEASAGKDTTTGHWEMMGILTTDAFPTFPLGFPNEILEPFIEQSGIPGVLGNKAASGTTILDELGPEHQRTGKPIIYTSADSVFQIAAHEEVISVEDLYRISKVARRILDTWRVGRVIARPFVGSPGSYKRTYNRADFSFLPPDGTFLERAAEAGFSTVGVGKIHDIFAGKGVSRNVHTEGNADGLRATLDELSRMKRAGEQGIVFTNLVDFDMLFGHRRDPVGYAGALRQLDDWLPALQAQMGPEDALFLTADHGGDPTYAKHTNHTREYVPILAWGPQLSSGVSLGTRSSFADLGQTLADNFSLEPLEHGTSFLADL